MMTRVPAGSVRSGSFRPMALCIEVALLASERTWMRSRSGNAYTQVMRLNKNVVLPLSSESVMLNQV